MYNFSKMFSVILIRKALLPTLVAPRIIMFIVVWFLIESGLTHIIDGFNIVLDVLLLLAVLLLLLLLLLLFGCSLSNDVFCLGFGALFKVFNVGEAN
jgi:hypothetical protein